MSANGRLPAFLFCKESTTERHVLVKLPLNISEKKGSGVAARVTVVEYFDKPRFDQAGHGFAGCR